MLIVTFSSLLPNLIFAKTVSKLATVWDQSPLKEDEGLLHVSFENRGDQTEELKLKTPVSFYVANLATKEVFQIQQRLPKESIPPLYRMKAGKYAVIEVSAPDQGNQVRKAEFRKSSAKDFVVQQASIANLFTWVLSPEGDQRLQVGLKRTSSPFALQPAPTGVEKIIDALDGSTQHSWQENDSKADTPEEIDAQAAGFYFSLNLLKNNELAPLVASALAEVDSDFRTCFVNYLKKGGTEQGEFVIKFAYSKKIMKLGKIKVSKSFTDDRDILKCLLKTLKQTEISLQRNVLGELTLHFELVQPTQPEIKNDQEPTP